MKACIPLERVLPQGAHRLPGSTRVLRSLRRRGVPLSPVEGESGEGFQARMETALMALFRDRRGEEEFQALYEYARPAVLKGVAQGMRGHGAWLDPQELCQDAFVNVYRYAASFRDEHSRSFKAWVQAICRNVVRRHLSGRVRPSTHGLPEGVAEPADHRDGPQACASIKEERASLTRAWSLLMMHYMAAWQELSPRDRQALELVEVEGLSYLEACERLRVGMSNMKMIMFRARRRIRARIAQAMGLGQPQIEERRVG